MDEDMTNKKVVVDGNDVAMTDSGMSDDVNPDDIPQDDDYADDEVQNYEEEVSDDESAGSIGEDEVDFLSSVEGFHDEESAPQDSDEEDHAFSESIAKRDGPAARQVTEEENQDELLGMVSENEGGDDTYITAGKDGSPRYTGQTATGISALGKRERYMNDKNHMEGEVSSEDIRKSLDGVSEDDLEHIENFDKTKSIFGDSNEEDKDSGSKSPDDSQQSEHYSDAESHVNDFIATRTSSVAKQVVSNFDKDNTVDSASVPPQNLQQTTQTGSAQQTMQSQQTSSNFSEEQSAQQETKAESFSVNQSFSESHSSASTTQSNDVSEQRASANQQEQQMRQQQIRQQAAQQMNKPDVQQNNVQFKSADTQTAQVQTAQQASSDAVVPTSVNGQPVKLNSSVSVGAQDGNFVNDSMQGAYVQTLKSAPAMDKGQFVQVAHGPVIRRVRDNDVYSKVDVHVKQVLENADTVNKEIMQSVAEVKRMQTVITDMSATVQITVNKMTKEYGNLNNLNMQLEQQLQRSNNLFSDRYLDNIQKASERTLSAYIESSRDNYMELFKLATRDFRSFCNAAMKFQRIMEDKISNEFKNMVKIIYLLPILVAINLLMTGYLVYRLFFQ